MIKPELYKYIKEHLRQTPNESNIGELILKSQILEQNPKLLLNITIELHDEVDYLFTEDSLKNLKKKDPFVQMRRLYDRTERGIPFNEILQALTNNTTLDYIE